MFDEADVRPIEDPVEAVSWVERRASTIAAWRTEREAEEGVAEKKALVDRYNEVAANYSDETADEMAKLQDQIDSQNLWDLDSQVTLAMDALRCPPDDADVTKLSGGERRRVALCKLLLDQPELLLLDEPTNHLDAESVSWLEGHLRNYPGAILIVTHDRYFLDNVTSWILELDRGKGIPYEGNYSSWLVQKQKRLEQEGREEAARQRQAEKRHHAIGLDLMDAANDAAKAQGCEALVLHQPAREAVAMDAKIGPGDGFAFSHDRGGEVIMAKQFQQGLIGGSFLF